MSAESLIYYLTEAESRALSRREETQEADEIELAAAHCAERLRHPVRVSTPDGLGFFFELDKTGRRQKTRSVPEREPDSLYALRDQSCDPARWSKGTETARRRCYDHWDQAILEAEKGTDAGRVDALRHLMLAQEIVWNEGGGSEDEDKAIAMLTHRRRK